MGGWVGGWMGGWWSCAKDSLQQSKIGPRILVKKSDLKPCFNLTSNENKCEFLKKKISGWMGLPTFHSLPGGQS